MNPLILEQSLESIAETSLRSFSTLLFVDVRNQQILGLFGSPESLGEHLVLCHQGALGGRGAVDLLDDFVEFDPAVFGGGLVGGNGHDEGDQTIGTGARHGFVVDQGIAKGNGFRDVCLVVSGQEKVKGHVGVSGVVLLVNLGGVGVDVVGLDHSLGSQDLGTLIVSERRLAADINHSLNAVGVSNDAGGGVVLFGAVEFGDGLVDVGRSDGEDIDGVLTGQESRHVEIVDGHVGKDATATLDVRGGWGSGVTGAQFDHDGFSDFLGGNGLLDTLKVLVESSLQTNHELDTGFVTGIDRLDGLRQIGGNGLFAKDVFVCGGAGLDLIGVELGRRTDPNRIDLRVVDDVHGIVGEFGNVVLAGGGFGLGNGGVGNNNGDDTGSLGDGFQVDQTDAAHADDTDLDNLLGIVGFDVHGERR
mmetsp:Transcript_7418/g.15926  ORF Transcript_7418/g.15926 Transcript_7418/m.15926 type:complete len:418 (+) Transcript_7418:306-1559(+)